MPFELQDRENIAHNVHQVHEAPRARRQPGEGVSTASPKLLPFTACGGKQRNALRCMNLVLGAVRFAGRLVMILPYIRSGCLAI